MTDIHLQTMYKPNVSSSTDYWCCNAPDDPADLLDTNAYFGRYGCDLPELMVERAFQKMAADNPDLDYILIPGDYVGHSIGIQDNPGDDVSFKDA